MKQIIFSLALLIVSLTGSLVSVVNGQSVCLPAPRLLTVTPMGGQVGTSVEVTIKGESLEGASELHFSHPGISATPKKTEQGEVVPNQYVLSIAADCPTGMHEARVMTRLGASSARAFQVWTLPEVSRAKANTTLTAAMPLSVNTICNAYVTSRSIDYYSLDLQEGQRVVIDCAASGIDSKLNPVLALANESGQDLVAERRGGVIDYNVETSGKYVVKVHDLTFNGGEHFYYRLAVTELPPDQLAQRLPSTRSVSSFSWPPVGFDQSSLIAEVEPNNQSSEAMKVSLPCSISGSFSPAADVDCFEFEAKKGEVWWVEVASERLGRPTDPSLVIQRIDASGDSEKLIDVLELTDIASPVKVSSNGYSYDGPPYNPGSPDILGKLEVPEDGRYRLQITDLFGGTRTDPQNVYQLVIRKATPDFALVSWPFHFGLRNGDRNALSKPIALRAGASVALEVVAIRRDGFDGPIELTLDNLPAGVKATGLTIPAGKSRGIMVVSADDNAPQGLSSARFQGTAKIGDQTETRICHWASMAWPVRNAWSEIPSPRLMADVPVSVCDAEQAPISITSAEDKVYEAAEGEKLTIPLAHHRRCDFSGTKLKLKTFGGGFEKVPDFDIPLDADSSEATIDLAALKVKPGEYVIAFYGSAVAKYSYCPEMVAAAEEALTNLKNANAPEATIKAAENEVKAAVNRAKPKDIVDIVVTTPIRIRVNPAKGLAKK